MKKPLHVLMVEDSEDDALLTIHALKKGGYDPVYERVETAEAMRNALRNKPWDVILCDYQMPQFNGLAAISLLKETGIDIPLIIVSGAIGEEVATECMRLGARDFFIKGKLPRLASAVERELEEAESRDQNRRAEKALRESEQYFRTIIENSSDIILIMDKLGTITYASPSIEHILGYIPDELIGKRTLDLIVSDDKPRAIADFGKALLTKEVPIPNVFRTRHKDGTERILEGVGKNLLDNLIVAGFVMNVHDITEHKRAEEEIVILAEIGRIIGSSLDINEVYERFADEVRNLIPFDRIVVNVCNIHENIVTVAYVSGIDIPGRKKGDSPSLVGTMSELVLHERTGLIIQSENIDEIVTRMPALSHTFEAGLRSLMGVPLIYKDEAIGALQFRSKKPNAYTDRDLRLAERVGAQIAGAVANANLFTDLKKTEILLRENEGRFRSLFEQAAVGVAEIEITTGRFFTVNRRLGEILGRTEEELLAATFHMFTHPDDIYLHEGKTALLLAGKISYYNLEKRYLRKDGETIWVNLTVSPLWKPGETHERNMIVVEDITERKRAEEALRENDERYRALVENASDLVYRMDGTGHVTFVNPAGLRITGYREEELIGKNYSTLIHPDMRDDAIKFFGRQFVKGIPHTYSEYPVIMKDGREIWLGQNTELIVKDGNVIGFQAVSRDITERKQAEEKLQQTLESLRKAVGTTIQVLAYTVETRDPYTAGHQTRSADLARAIGTEMELPQEKIDAIRIAGSIHDIGKLSIPAEILSKPTKLSEIEFALIKEHSRKGYEMLKDVESPWPLAEIVYQHHERIDGSGYPRNLKREEILIEARILAVADVVEAMASHRPYRPGLGIEAALNEIEKNSGLFYDNAVADACLRLFREKGFQLAVT